MIQYTDNNNTPSWATSVNGINRLDTTTGMKSISVDSTDTLMFDKDKNYQMITSFTGYGSPTVSITIDSNRLTYSASTHNDMILYTNFTKNEDIEIKNIGLYTADVFTQSYINKTELIELDFIMNGYAKNNHSGGWIYDINNKSYVYIESQEIPNDDYGYVYNGAPTFIATEINYDIFNVSFDSTAVLIYFQIDDLKDITDNTKGINSKIGNNSVVGLNIKDGKYLVFRYTKGSGTLSKINITGSYYKNNNREFTFTHSVNGYDYEITNAEGAIYNYEIGSDGSINNYKSRVGNGYFKSGIWENGVWNNGWRDDETVVEFNQLSYSKISDIKYKVKLFGEFESKFKIGDKIAIGNIIAIDINETRKLLKDYYTISNISENTYIEFDVDITFPIMRIDIDSLNHKIKVTKNVWLSGLFLNGYFSGVWNNGLFRGKPYLTEMVNTSWVDGQFDGGRFESKYLTYSISGTNSLTGLTVSGAGLSKNDHLIISNNIYKIESMTGSNGTYSIILDKPIEINPGVAQRYTATSLIQNFKFKDANRGDLNFNSWMDINYDESRAVNIGKDIRDIELYTNRSISENNLYGFPSYDILSSESTFINTFDKNEQTYKLGTKFNVYDDYIGSNSEFNDPFGPNLSNFLNFGWTYSNTPIISRTSDVVGLVDGVNTIGNELYVNANTHNTILNNDKINIENNRYSLIEFDIITTPNTTTYSYYTHSNSTIKTFNKLEYKDALSERIGTSSTISYTSSYIVNEDVKYSNIYELSVILDIKRIWIGDLIINLRSPKGEIINIKQVKSAGDSNEFSKLEFTTNESVPLFIEASPINSVYSGVYQMDKIIGQGLSASNVSNFNINNSIKGEWVLEITNTTGSYEGVLNYWSLVFINIIEPTGVNSDIILPSINFNNLNYTIKNQIIGNNKEIIYTKRLNLPITDNVNHLAVNNTYRLNSIDSATPENWGDNPNKKYEYFYNKRDLMLNINNNKIILDNIKFYQVDMIPFFKYFNNKSIYKGIVIPEKATSPKIDISNNFKFIDNVKISIDYFNS